MHFMLERCRTRSFYSFLKTIIVTFIVKYIKIQVSREKMYSYNPLILRSANMCYAIFQAAHLNVFACL